MSRGLVVLVFAVAAAGTTLAGTGLVVAPHVDPPGTPLFHVHALGSYRYWLYELRLMPRVATSVSFEEPTLGVAFGEDLVLYLLAMLASRLPRPSLHPIARLAPPALRFPQWRARVALGPPRRTIFLTIPS